MNIDEVLKLYIAEKNENKDIRFASYNIDIENLSCNIILSSSSVVFKEQLDEIKGYILSKQDFYPFEVSLECRKIVADKEMAFNAIVNYIKEHFFSIALFFKPENIHVDVVEGGINYTVGVLSLVKESFNQSQINEINTKLSRELCCDFNGKVIYYESEKDEQISADNYTYDSSVPDRYFTLKYVTKFTDEQEDYKAIYIADGKDRLGEHVFAGYITDIEKRTTKAGKDYYVVRIDDKTGRIEGKYFSRNKAKLKKMERLAPGSVISMRGNNEMYEGNISFLIEGVNLCEFPNTPIQERESKKAPEKYLKINPSKAEILKQGSLFEMVPEPPQNMIGKVFTVVDVETTGKSSVIDKVTEIGAVKIVDGVITEQWTSLINPQVQIDEKITELTGIDNEMVKDCPIISDVYPDFFKFVDKTIFVGHNVNFDFSFLSKAGKDNGFILTNEVEDTLELSRKLLKGLKNYKLNTVCELYNIQFNHHRALADAYATAELLIHLKRKELETI